MRALLVAAVGGLVFGGTAVPAPGELPLAETPAAKAPATPTEAELRYERLAEEFRAARDEAAADPDIDEIIRMEAEAIAGVAEELMQEAVVEAEVELAVELIRAALDLLRPDRASG